MRRCMTVIVALMLLMTVLTVPAMAFSGAPALGDSNNESGAGNSGPVVGEGAQKEFGTYEEEPDSERVMSDATEEPTWATEAMDYTKGNWEIDSDGEAVPDEPVSQVHEETEPILAGSEEGKQEESFLKKLFVQKTAETEIWKLVVLAAGVAASLAALVALGKKGAKPASIQERTSMTVMEPWDNKER